MAASGRVIGIILLGVGVILGIGITVWLISGINEGTLEGSGAALGFILLFGFLVLPLVGGGIFFLVRGRSEAKELATFQEQRALLDAVKTRGMVQISDLVLDLKSTTEKVQQDLRQLVGRGLFSGYVDWDKGVLYSVEASKLQGQQNCPNCGGQVELAGKGLIKCPYCGAEIFL
ncbi:MAG: zinc ribbon domain-containing protein [Thermomicrobiales bacterium]